ncbi:hypothetical protein BT93_I0540 [Corymbia citriodora subsp. variegata]|nr:hypothetical protein BT93_I0540 [Corymbia citriodora subsp. variegata]
MISFLKISAKFQSTIQFADYDHTKFSAAELPISGTTPPQPGRFLFPVRAETPPCSLGFSSFDRPSEREREDMSAGVARGRLSGERKAWRKNHPHGFVAKPETAPDGSANLMVWHCTIPGRAGTDWEGGNYPLTLYFTEDYPSKAPKCMFPKDFFHLNVYGSGMGWRPSITVRQILVGIQDLLHQPNPASPAKYVEYQLFVKDPAEYQRRVRQQAKQYPALV